MGVMDGAGDRGREPCRGARLASKTLDLGSQVASVHELHAEVVVAVVLADLVDRHDIRVIEMGGGLGLQAEPLQIVGRGEPAGADHLERQHAIQAHLPGLVDNTHPTLGDDLDQLVIAEVADARLGRARRRPFSSCPRSGAGTLVIASAVKRRERKGCRDLERAEIVSNHPASASNRLRSRRRAAEQSTGQRDPGWRRTGRARPPGRDAGMPERLDRRRSPASSASR